MQWRWVPSGERRGFAIGDMDQFHELQIIPAIKRLDLSNRIHLQGAVWKILYSARNAYAVGNADYEGATENLSKLLGELYKATEQIEATVNEIVSFLDPKPDLEAMEMKDRLELAQVAIINAKSEKK